ncbi:uncharacterized protein LOC130612698 [Hydractinia symbiolongicarpus]|uniref:uncharacterized protein LOC130612698 n=1 Tax=Hydractinia symbiolongicarpus TaxID=13093 RepID=UPI00254DD37B|nr:uncharacterized protein LOC130612698 [Hydractinia symbiolongicarpus]
MTVPTPCEHDKDITKDAIDQIFLQPVETLEMLMNSFSTDPTSLNIQSGNLANIVSESTVNGEHFKLDSDDDQKCSVGGYADNEIQNVMLPEGTSSQSALFLEKGTPLAKVDNFVDETENIIISSPASSKSSGVVFAPKQIKRTDDKEDTANYLNLKGCASEANFKVEMINSVHHDDPLPGEAVVYQKPSPIVKSTQLLLSQSTEKMECHHEEKNDDSVESFKLDENFDYDQVAFTPKFDASIVNLPQR